MAEIAIVDDEKVLVNSLRIGLTRKGYQVRPFEAAQPFLSYLRGSEPDVIFLDLHLPDIHGLEVLKKIKQVNPHIPTIIITAHGDVPSAVNAMKSGAFDYVGKPFDIEEIELLIQKALKETRLTQEIVHHRLRSHQSVRLDNIVGTSPAMQAVFETVTKLFQIDATTVLLLGESGTGKDLLAKAIHNHSCRVDQPFIEINCAALPEQLLESELFGYEKGAFTDAKQRKVGLIEIAAGGTLYLDEIGEMPLALQSKLLKFLETRSFRRLGGTTEIRVDLFIIASTNRDLEVAVAQKTFRHDLFYRLNVVPIQIPPLRDRGDDILQLASHYLDVYCRRFNKPQIAMEDAVRRSLAAHDWPGNVRELKNLVERLVILSGDARIRYDDLPADLRERLAAAPHPLDSGAGLHNRQDRPGNATSLSQVVDRFERELIEKALKEAGGVKSEAAALLGISRYALLRKLKRYPSSGV